MTATSFPREEIRILLLEGVAESAVNTLRNAGYTQIDYRAGPLSSADRKAANAEAQVAGHSTPT